ncbi:uncharacterized protein MONOS_7538 [Monocercomonoides exilis]|uniref:uncharacterized protein n=1 Tax=Monocercomonoides exilis TaxID=2049356 RepID=UPI003559C633|nr:hypothetical protein MONOS_7538 [Monocercomonoides exilis]|eukprot:MONOS_7538.1-p1 / transcript=MONOS_7538.1 / gene=MONOS_7538 / organism=Monocercomonoides_exilis_PA203 / gene_product=unspecified product / transcript_product=unspecified product / location=Mono_scaffold00260:8451-9709(-) / protein_length=364 / sequence_SO=supercontig / SO=protein_coding / is_pseudo=false
MISPLLDISSGHESFVQVILDPFHSHQANVFSPLFDILRLVVLNVFCSLPVTLTFRMRQHPTNEVFETVKDAKGLLREGTIPPSYASQTDENEHPSIRVLLSQPGIDAIDPQGGIDDPLKKFKSMVETLSAKRDDKNGFEGITNNEKHDEQIEIWLNQDKSDFDTLEGSVENSRGNCEFIEFDEIRVMFSKTPQLSAKSSGCTPFSSFILQQHIVTLLPSFAQAIHFPSSAFISSSLHSTDKFFTTIKPSSKLPSTCIPFPVVLSAFDELFFLRSFHLGSSRLVAIALRKRFEQWFLVFVTFSTALRFGAIICTKHSAIFDTNCSSHNFFSRRNANRFRMQFPKQKANDKHRGYHGSTIVSLL